MTLQPLNKLFKNISFNVICAAFLVVMTACGGSAPEEQKAENVETINTPQNPPPPTGNSVPTVSITSPANGQSVNEGGSVNLTANASDDEDGDISGNIEWASNIDGNLGSGSNISAVLSAGDHAITATVADSDGESNQASIDFIVNETVNTAPVINITSPVNQAVIESNTTISFSANASDEQDGDISGSISWASNIDGNLGIGANISARLSVGDHIITASVTDSEQADVSSSVNLEIDGPIVNLVQDSSRIDVVLEVSRTSCVAPCGIMFDATETTSLDFAEAFNQLDYDWDYDDAGATFINKPGVDANLSSAPIGSHVFTEPGSYRVQLTVTDNNNEVEVMTVNIAVQSPNPTFSENTYCVSSSDDFSSCPNSDNSYHLNSFAQARGLLENLNRNSPATRFLFKAGDTFALNSTTMIRDLESPLLISTYGGANNAIFDVQVGTGAFLFTVRDVDGFTISNIDFEGNYNPTNGQGAHPTVLFIAPGSKNTTIYQNSFSGLGLPAYVSGRFNDGSGKASEFNMVVDNFITDWQDYAIFGDLGYLSAIVGNSIKQNVNAQRVSEGKCGSCVPNYPDHGPFRAALSDHLLIQYNDMFNNAGWSSGGRAHQSNLRLGTNGEVISSIVADNVMEGGLSIVDMVPANSSSSVAARRAEVIIERNRMTASDNTSAGIKTELGGIVVRNNVFFKPNNGAPEIGTRSFKRAILFTGSNVTSQNLLWTNKIYNNSLVSIADTTAPNLAFIEIEDGFQNFEIHNNLVSLPLVSGSGDAGLISWQQNESLSGITANNNLLHAPNSTNFVWNNGGSLTIADWQSLGNGASSQIADPRISEPSTGNVTLLQNSPAINNGADVNGLFDDFNAQSRDSSTDIGAIEF